MQTSSIKVNEDKPKGWSGGTLFLCVAVFSVISVGLGLGLGLYYGLRCARALNHGP